MPIQNPAIDAGTPFDWGRVSEDYARYRDIYPEEFYQRIIRRGLCVRGQRVLDLGTGTGVLPRNLARFGAQWTGTDISPEQIRQAEQLSRGMGIEYHALAAEELPFPDGSFDTVTACQCFFYFRHETLAPLLQRILTPDGRLVLLYMAWLPAEDPIAGASERLALRYSPQWSGAGETVHPIAVPEAYRGRFEPVFHEEYRLPVHFTRERWHGRMRACRGVGASLSPEALCRWDAEHRALLQRIAPPEFDVLHYAALSELRRL